MRIKDQYADIFLPMGVFAPLRRPRGDLLNSGRERPVLVGPEPRRSRGCAQDGGPRRRWRREVRLPSAFVSRRRLGWCPGTGPCAMRARAASSRGGPAAGGRAAPA